MEKLIHEEKLKAAMTYLIVLQSHDYCLLYPDDLHYSGYR